MTQDNKFSIPDRLQSPLEQRLKSWESLLMLVAITILRFPCGGLLNMTRCCEVGMEPCNGNKDHHIDRESKGFSDFISSSSPSWEGGLPKSGHGHKNIKSRS